MSQRSQAPHSPRYAVTVGGETYRESGGRIADVVVETTLDGADRFSLTLNAPFDREHEEFLDYSWDTFSTGTSVSISTGWGDGELTPMFAGKIQRITTDFSSDQGPTVGVSGYGQLHELTRNEKDRSWTDTAIGDVVQEVLSEQFGDTTVEDAKTKPPQIMQHGQSDYRLVEKLADEFGFRFYARMDSAWFVPRSSMGGDPVATLRYGSVLESFSAEINEANEVQEVEVRHWDMENEKEIVGTASTDAKNTKKEVFRRPCDSEDHAEDIAQTKLDALSSDVVSANGETGRGVPALTAGNTVTVENMGEKFSKDYYVTGATHRIGSSGYRTSFDAREVPE